MTNTATNGKVRVTPRSLGKPSASFPGAVAGDSKLAIAVDRQQTTLAATLNTGDTSMTVASAAQIVTWSLLSIDNEIVQVNGPATGNVVPVTRAWDGTTAAIHLSGTAVLGLVDAYHHNTLVAEVEAIENALGANLSKIPSISQVISSAFIFPAQSPGGNLIAGNNSITLSPVPPGVNGTDQYHYLYISGGTGAAEAVLITGGSAVAGAPSGTLIVNCANAHSGAWTIQTATAGMQEAVVSIPNGGMVTVPPGTWQVYAPTTMAADYVSIQGTVGGSCVVANHNTGSIFSFNQIGNGAGGPHGWFNGLCDIRMAGPATPGSLTAVLIRGQLGLRIIDNNIQGVFQGIWVNDTSGAVSSAMFIHRNVILNVPQNGIAIRITGGADHFILNNHMTGASTTTPAAAGILLESSAGSKIIANEVYLFGVGLQMSPGSGLYVAAVESIDNWYDSSQGDCCKIAPQGTGTITEIRSCQDRFATSTGNGISILGSSANVLTLVISEALVSFNRGQGIYYTGGTDVELNGCHVYGNSNASPGTNHGLNVAAGASNLRVHGGTYAQASEMPGGSPPNTQGYGILINSGASDYIVIEGAVVTPNVSGGLISGATGTHNVIRNCIGYNPVGQAAITVGASPFTYTAGASPEVVYISGGTVSNIKVGATTVLAASPAQLALAPNQSITVTYSVAPTMVKDVQ